MNGIKTALLTGASLLALALGVNSVQASQFNTQCPPDSDGMDTDGDGIVDNDNVCVHVVGTDGFLKMADGRRLYSFGFTEVPPSAAGTPPGDIMDQQMLGAELPAPTLRLREGQKLYLTLSNIPFVVRPDLFDPHTVHWHGFPNASSIYDGVPDLSIAPNPLASVTYFYNIVRPGTYMWHCHVEATEHMQMGMLGNLYVEPKQNFTTGGGVQKFVYNDGDGSTAYDVEYPIQIHGLDEIFHDASESTQPLPFADLEDRYLMLNGRGYPDTVRTDAIGNGDDEFQSRTPNADPVDIADDGTRFSQKVSSLIEATQGEKVLLRVSSLSTTEIFSLTVPGITMNVVGNGSRELRGPHPEGMPALGKVLHYKTNSLTLGGGESMDVILDTGDVAPGTYFLYTSNLNHLSNNTEDFGGMMTEIRVAAAP